MNSGFLPSGDNGIPLMLMSVNPNSPKELVSFRLNLHNKLGDRIGCYEYRCKDNLEDLELLRCFLIAQTEHRIYSESSKEEITRDQANVLIRQINDRMAQIEREQMDQDVLDSQEGCY